MLGPIWVADLPAIGSEIQGGFSPGLISHTANGLATHALIISPKTPGSLLNVAWKSANTSRMGTTSVFVGWSNSETMNKAYNPTAQFCRLLTTYDYNVYCIAASEERDILWRAFRPEASAAGTYSGACFGSIPYAVQASNNYSESNAPVTSVIAFRPAAAEMLRLFDENYGDDPFFHWVSTQAAICSAYQCTTTWTSSLRRASRLPPLPRCGRSAAFRCFPH